MLFLIFHSRMDWTMVPVFTDETSPLDQHQALSWCKSHIVGRDIVPVENFIDAICLALGCDEMKLRQKVREQMLETQSFTNTMVMCWITASGLFNSYSLLEQYAKQGALVDGLFLWLSSVVTRTHLNFVHSASAWTSRASEKVDMTDATIVAAGNNFLVAKTLAPGMPKSVLKHDDEYCDPLMTRSRFIPVAFVLRNPVRNPEDCCQDLGLETTRHDRPLSHLLAELFSLSPLCYQSQLSAWIQQYSVHLDSAHTWWKACGQTIHHYQVHLDDHGPADGLEILLVSLALDTQINVILEDHVYSMARAGVDFDHPTVIITSAGARPCRPVDSEPYQADADTSTVTSDSFPEEERVAFTLAPCPYGGRPLAALAEYRDSGTTSSLEMQDSDVDGCFVEDNDNDNVPVPERKAPSGVALPQKRKVCSVCVDSKSVLIVHMRQFHPGEKSYSCGVCDKRFDNEADLGCHTTNVHSSKKLQCKSCPYRAVNGSRMHAHVKCHAPGLKCNKCNKF